jgi:hypothetical protein
MSKGTRIFKLVEAIVKLREDNAFDNPIRALINLKQTSTVEKYQSQFEVLSIRILTRLNKEFWESRFVSGIKENIKITVTMLKPTSLKAAFGLAKFQEEEFLRRTWAPKNCKESQEIALEEQEVQPQNEEIQELEPAFATEEHLEANSKEFLEEPLNQLEQG